MKRLFGSHKRATSEPSTTSPAVRMFQYHGAPKLLLDPRQLTEDPMVELVMKFHSETKTEPR